MASELEVGKLGAGIAPAATLHAKVAATTGTSPLEVARLEVKDEGVNLDAGMGPKMAFYMPHNSASFEGASIAAKKEDGSDTHEATSLVFSTCPNAGTNTERLTISSTGSSTFTRDGLPVTSDRTGSDGDAIHVRKDNYTRLRLTTLGITFPNGGTAPTSAAANRLDYYEEGTWTPTDGSGAGLTFSSESGYYTRIGQVVHTTFALQYPSNSDSTTMKIAGLPFTPRTSYRFGGSWGYTSSGVAADTAITNNTTRLVFRTSGGSTVLTNTQLSNVTVRGNFTFVI